MPHKLLRLASSVYNTPQLITVEALKPVIEYLEHRNTLGFIQQAPVEQESTALQFGKIGEIVINGALTYKPVDAMCSPEGCSYTSLLDQAGELISNGITTLVLTMSTPGGQAAHCFDTCEQLREMADEADVEIVAYIDQSTASAGLALAVIADEVIIHPSSSFGSIGCVVCLLDQSKAMATAGMKPIYISSTAGKVPVNEDGSFSEAFLEGVQKEVTRLGNEFASHVNKYTGIAVEDVLAMDARMFNAGEALEAGLVSSIMTHKQFANYLASKG